MTLSARRLPLLFLLVILLGYFALPVHRVLPVCNTPTYGAIHWQTVGDMSPIFRRLFAEGLRDWDLPFVEVGDMLLTWPHVTFLPVFGDARVNVANHLTLPLANPDNTKDVLSGLQFGFPVRLPPDLWRRLWDYPEMDECDKLRIAVHLEPNEP